MNNHILTILLSLLLMSGCATSYVDAKTETSYGRYTPHKVNRAVEINNNSLLLCFYGSYMATWGGGGYGSTINDAEFSVLISNLSTPDKQFDSKTIKLSCDEYLNKIDSSNTDTPIYIIKTKNQCISNYYDKDKIECSTNRCNNASNCEGVNWEMYKDKAIIDSGYTSKEKHEHNNYYSTADLVKNIDKYELTKSSIFIVEESYSILVEAEEQDEFLDDGPKFVQIKRVHNDIYYFFHDQIFYFELQKVTKEGEPLWNVLKPLSVAFDIITIPIQIPMAIIGASQIGN